MIKYIIVDDEHIAHDIIKGYGDLLPNLELQRNCYDAMDALAYLSSHEVDLIFLDLNMPKLKGFELLKTLVHPPKVIVTTAYSEYALEGYELNVVDYLLKPFGFERFLRAVNKAISNPSSTVPTQAKTSVTQRIFLYSNNQYFQIVIDDILYLEAAGNYIKVVTTHSTLLVRSKLSELLAQLPSDDFIQAHRSFAVAIRHIKSIEGNRIMVNSAMVPVGKMYKMNLNKLLGT